METDINNYIVVHALNDVMTVGSMLDEIDDTFYPFIGLFKCTHACRFMLM